VGSSEQRQCRMDRVPLGLCFERAGMEEGRGGVGGGGGGGGWGGGGGGGGDCESVLEELIKETHGIKPKTPFAPSNLVAVGCPETKISAEVLIA